MKIKEWAEKNRIAPPYLKSAINQIQYDKVERVVVNKHCRAPKTDITTKIYTDGREGQYFCKCCHCDRIFIGDKRDVNCGECIMGRKSPLPDKLICISNPGNGESHIRQMHEGTKKDNHPGVRVYHIKTAAIDVQKDGIVASTFNKEFFSRPLGKPWRQQIHLEEKFQREFNDRFARKAMVEDISQMHGPMRINAVDRQQIKTWIDQWILSHGDLSEDFKHYANTFLENQFQRKP